jgi:diguanylate cyclase (GGDEF)-like protein
MIENSYILLGDEKLHVTVSIGATMVRDDDTIDSLVKRADALMYESKQSGRNRLTMG